MFETDDFFGYVPKPACEPIADKPWSCEGVGDVDRYDCINGVVTLTEKDSTACGYQVPDPNAEPPTPTGIDIKYLLAGLGVVALAGLILFVGRK
jgi:hypothetical protein